MAQHICSIDSLPNEILINALESFNTRSLLPVAAVSRRFRGVVGRLHYYRLVHATILREHELILECCQPIDKLSTQYLFCRYLDTDGLLEVGEDTDFEDMNHLYTRFEPLLDGEDHSPRARVTDCINESLPRQSPSYEISLEADEPFTQLCVSTDLVKAGPGRGLFLSNVKISDGFIRVWRHWLHDQAARSAVEAEQQYKQSRPRTSLDDPSILWTDSSKNIGLKFRVKAVEQQPQDATPMLTDAGEEPAVSYILEYEELIIRTNRLWLGVETSEVQHSVETLLLLGSDTTTPELEAQYSSMTNWAASPALAHSVPAH